MRLQFYTRCKGRPERGDLLHFNNNFQQAHLKCSILFLEDNVIVKSPVEIAIVEWLEVAAVFGR